jgi:hypothetical protein
MSISGENAAEASDGEEEVYINEEDIIHEVTIDDEGAFRSLYCYPKLPLPLHTCELLITTSACLVQIYPTAMRMMMPATGWVRWRVLSLFWCHLLGSQGITSNFFFICYCSI